ncbi:MAG: YihY/virulence factor BrkB family protein [Blastocatellia bacterium]|nr:YihY/virulence factor BrkB family protein [Blastocatellia bacterium]
MSTHKRRSPQTRGPRRIISQVGQIWDKLFTDDIFGRAAQLAYYWLFSLFPLLIFLTALLAYLPLKQNIDQWLGALNNVLPPEAFSLIRNTFAQITARQRGGLLSFSILATLWASSSGMEAIIIALNKAFDVPATRPWWKDRLIAILLTLGLAGFIISALALIFFGGWIGGLVARSFGFNDAFRNGWNLAQWPLAMALLLLALELIYYFAPNLKHEKRWEWFTPGTLFALLFWLAISFGFRFYVAAFGNFNATYGALGGVMILMLWLYLTGIAILVGGVINSVTRRP